MSFLLLSSKKKKTAADVAQFPKVGFEYVCNFDLYYFKQLTPVESFLFLMFLTVSFAQFVMPGGKSQNQPKNFKCTAVIASTFPTVFCPSWHCNVLLWLITTKWTRTMSSIIRCHFDRLWHILSLDQLNYSMTVKTVASLIKYTAFIVVIQSIFSFSPKGECYIS